MSSRPPLVVLLIAATAGLLFASYATIDFVAHLDRQVHELHCSFVPGVVDADPEAEGCKVTLMSPYSSVMRRAMWGGLPISLPAMAMFAFLLFRGIDLWGRAGAPVASIRTSANILLVATLVPVAASIVMGWIAFTKLDAACKLCIGIYICSGIAFLAALWARLAVGSDSNDTGAASSPGRAWLFGGAQLVGFVATPVVAYLALAPDFSRYIASCDSLEDADDPYGVLVPLDRKSGGVPVIEVLDPLCPACKAFEERLAASDLAERMHRVALVFPLDETCNKMVGKSLHPGACAVSEAILCAHRQGTAPEEVLTWAFENQEAILAAEKQRPGSAAERVSERFSALRGCLGSAEVKSDLNKSLRWAIANKLPVMTPQIYVDGVKLCDEDTDLGMEWALEQMLQRHAAGTLPKPPAKPKDEPALPAAKRDDDRGPTTKRSPAASPERPRTESKPPTTPAAERPKRDDEPQAELPTIAEEPSAPAEAPKTPEPTVSEEGA